MHTHVHKHTHPYMFRDRYSGVTHAYTSTHTLTYSGIGTAVFSTAAFCTPAFSAKMLRSGGAYKKVM